MMEIDGSYGEGGGQILRTSIALSAISGKAVTIENIRANRRTPGLSAQHLEAVRGVAMLTDAEVGGLALGSTEVFFAPREIKSGEYKLDIGTAGSIPLLLQCLMLAAIYADGPVCLKIRGGTDIRWSPSIDYVRYVMLPVVAKMGYDVQIDIVKRGYYPRGGGMVKAVIRPPTELRGVVLKSSRKIEIKGISTCRRSKNWESRNPIGISTCRRSKNWESRNPIGISTCSGLPEHVAVRQAMSARSVLVEEGYDARISTEVSATGESTGSGITLWHDGIGVCAIGERGKPAETVGREAAKSLLIDLKCGAAIDTHLSDQLIPYMALAKGECSFTTRVLTPHTKTNIWVTRQFFDVQFDIDEYELVRITKR